MSKPAMKRKLADNQASGALRTLRVSPRKLGLIAGLIRNRRVEDALTQLAFSRKAVAKPVYKLLQSVIANAENNHNLDVDRLVISEVMVGKGLVMKRFHTRARGRGVRVTKPFANITITVTEEQE